MAYDVFISYSENDKQIADAVVSALEKQNIHCFIGHRDINRGANKTANICKAITECPVMVLIFSKNSSNSSDIGKEITIAMSSKTVVIPFRIDDSPFNDEMRYHLSNTQWMDASNPFTKKELYVLISIVKKALPYKVETTKKEKNEKQPEKSPRKIKRGITIAITSVVILIAVAMLLFFILQIPQGMEYEKGLSLLKDKNYEQAITVFDKIPDYKDSEERSQECRYQIAMDLMLGGKYAEAEQSFNELANYKDSETYVMECRYLVALDLMSQGKHSEAEEHFLALDVYKDSDTQAKECRYQMLMSAMNQGNYDEVIMGFSALGAYKDSDQRIKTCNYQKALV